MFIKKTASLIVSFALAFFGTPSLPSLYAMENPPIPISEAVSDIEAPTVPAVPGSEPEADSITDPTTSFYSPNPLEAPDIVVSKSEESPETNFSEKVSLDIEEDVSFDFTLSNDAYYNASGNWWHPRVKAEEAWAYSRGTDVPIAVIDTGVDYNHPDLAANLWSNPNEVLDGIDNDGNGFVDDLHGWDYVNGDNDPMDDHGHGTHVSGIFGAVADNGIGIAGVAPESKIIPIKVLNYQGSGFVSHVISAIRYAADLGAKIINMSLGMAKNLLPKSLRQAIDSALNYAIKQKGVVVVAAAGNNGSNVSNTYPAAYPDVVAVGATDQNNKRAWFSNFGKLLDVVAPGVGNLSTKPKGVAFGSNCVGDSLYACASGTSMASPVAAGVAALVRARNPLLTWDQVVSILRSTATDLGARGFDSYYGYGLVNALAAVKAAGGAASSSSVSSSDREGGRRNKSSGFATSRSVDSGPWENPFFDEGGLPMRGIDGRLPLPGVIGVLHWSTRDIGGENTVRREARSAAQDRPRKKEERKASEETETQPDRVFEKPLSLPVFAHFGALPLQAYSGSDETSSPSDQELDSLSRLGPLALWE